MSENNEILNAEITVPGESSLAILEKASIDMQVATAKQYPRSLSAFKQRAISIATIDEEVAESCIYRRPVGRDPKTGEQTFAEGMSIRTAEIIGSCYGNLRVGARIIEQTDRYVKAQGVAHDLETNFFATSEVIESTVKKPRQGQKVGDPYDERMRIVVAKSALSKARRDATFMVVPKALAKPLEMAVRSLLYGDTKSITVRRDAAANWIKKLGIDGGRVFTALGVSGLDDMGIKELETLTGLRTAIKDNEITIDEAFPDTKAGNEAESVNLGASKFSAKKEEKKSEGLDLGEVVK